MYHAKTDSSKKQCLRPWPELSRIGRIVEVIFAVEARHVGRPQTPQPRHLLHGPERKVAEHIPAQTPAQKVFGTTNADARPRREQIEGFAFPDDAWVVNVANVSEEVGGLRWYEVDMNWWGIRALQLLGLAKDIKLVNAAGQAKGTDSTRMTLKRAA